MNRCPSGTMGSEDERAASMIMAHASGVMHRGETVEAASLFREAGAAARSEGSGKSSLVVLHPSPPTDLQMILVSGAVWALTRTSRAVSMERDALMGEAEALWHAGNKASSLDCYDKALELVRLPLSPSNSKPTSLVPLLQPDKVLLTLAGQG